MAPTARSRAHLAGTAAALLALLATAAPARAQAALDPVKVTARSAQADALDARAAELESIGRFRQAATVRERAARTRDQADARGAVSLKYAALDRYYGRQVEAAGTLMIAAAGRAAAIGDVYEAAQSYLDAAFITAELRRPDHARDLLDRSVLLMNSPLLGASQRAVLRARVAQTAGGDVQVAALREP